MTPDVEILLVRADNPGSLSLSGTNTWVVGRDPAWVIDPGPRPPRARGRGRCRGGRRGGLGGIALTHATPTTTRRSRRCCAAAGAAPVAAAHGRRDVDLAATPVFGPLRAVATPGHAAGHTAFVLDARDAFTGDAVLGEGSVFVAPGPGALAGYLDGLRRLRGRACAACTPAMAAEIEDADAKLDEYVAHRLEREQRLLAALDDGRRGVDELLDAAWSDAPEPPAAGGGDHAGRPSRQARRGGPAARRRRAS